MPPTQSGSSSEDSETRISPTLGQILRLDEKKFKNEKSFLFSVNVLKAIVKPRFYFYW